MVDRQLVDDALSRVLHALERSPAAAPRPPAGDAALLNDLITLLAGLEQERARGADRRADPVAGLTLLASVVNALVAFVTARCHESSVLPSRVLARLADADPY